MFNSLGLKLNHIDRNYVIPDGGPGLVEKDPQTVNRPAWCARLPAF